MSNIERNNEVIKNFKPQLLWEMFCLLSQVPRGSKKELRVAEIVVSLATKAGCVANCDIYGNVVISVSASPGYQNKELICLQSHLDMVCEKSPDSAHDFSVDPIEFLLREDGNLGANGTTLGADNGIGVATMLAIMSDQTIAHGPLELLFTVDEETGLNGVKKLPLDFIKSKKLINLDSEDWKEFFISSAGGMRTNCKLPIRFEAKPPDWDKYLEVTVKGLKGGHSGLEINRPHENPIKILGRVITALCSDDFAMLSRVNSGNKFNAIPRDATAVFCTSVAYFPTIKRKINRIYNIVKNEIGSFEPDFQITVGVLPNRGMKVISELNQRDLCRVISAIPHGVIRMSADVVGFVQTSTNLASIKTTKNSFAFQTMQRGSIDSETLTIVDSINSLFKLAHGTTSYSGWYPGWKANSDSALLTLAKQVFVSMFGEDPKVKAIHAGLECGVISGRFSGMDVLSFGPTIENVHSPDEYVEVETVEDYWNFLLTLLKA